MLTVIRLFVFCLDLYKNELEVKLSELAEAPVTIEHLSTKMYRLYPEIILKNISLMDTKNQQVSISLKEVHLGIDLIEMVLTGKLLAAIDVSLIGAKLSIIREDDGSFTLVGLKAGDGQPLWLLQGKQYQLLNSEISWLDKKRHGKKVSFKQVDLVIKNDINQNRHQIHFLSQLPSVYGEKLRVYVDIQGDMFKPANLNGQVFIEGKNIQVAKLLTGQLPLKLKLTQGRGDFKVWGEIQNSILTNLSGNINAKKLSLQRDDAKKLNFHLLKGRFNWVTQANNWRLDVENLVTTNTLKKAKTSKFSLGFKGKTNSQLAVNITQIDLKLLSRLNQFFTPLITNGIIPIKNISLDGILSEGLLFVDFNHQRYGLKANFKQLIIKGISGFKKLSNLEGSIQGTEKQGTLRFNSHNIGLTTKKFFRKTLKISKLMGDISWQQAEHNWVINTDNLHLDTPYLQSENKFVIKIPKNQEPIFIDLQTAFYNINKVSQLKRYLPIYAIQQETLTWMNKAFVSGSIKRGDLLFYGNLSDYPFNKNQGVFQVLFATQNLELAYAKHWPNFTGIKAEVMFLNESLEVNINHAKAGDIILNKVLAKIPFLGKSDYLLATVNAKGKIIDSLNWLQQTPLDLPVKEILDQLSIKGNHTIKVDLKIPLTDQVTEKVSGHVEFNQASVNVKEINLPVNNIKGFLNFDEQHFYTRKLRAIALGSAININIKDSAKAVNTIIKGNIDIKRLKQHFGMPNLTFATGYSDYKLQFTFFSDDKKNTKLQLNSDLVGLSLDLPKNLGKNPEEEKPFLLELSLDSRPLIPINIVYNKNLMVKLNFDKQRKKLHSANVLLGIGNIKHPTQKGVNIWINQPSFSPLPWLALIDNESKNSSSTLLTKINIETPAFNWDNEDLGAFKLTLSRGNNNWSGTINSTFATGIIHLPINTSKGKYYLNMEMINLSELVKLKFNYQNKSLKSSEKLPLIDIFSQQLIWRGVNLGIFNLNSKRDGEGVFFDAINLVGEQYKLSLTAHWNKQHQQSLTHLQGQLEAQEFGNLLKKLNFSDDLKETSAIIKLDLNWPAAPYQFSLATLNGEIELDLNEGRISSIEPGFGRLLGVLATAQWIKRLKLDFSDVYQEGLTFNTIKGHYNLQNGMAYSDDLIVDAIPAKISLKGEINLGQHSLKKEISVIPKSSAALPIAGTIVGSIATIIAQILTGEYEEGFYLRTKYLLQGNWDKLTVTPLHEQDGLLPKIGRGLTDFSWIVD